MKVNSSIIYFLKLIVLFLIQIQSSNPQYTKLRLIGNKKPKPQLPYHKLPLYGNMTLGYYYTNLYFGTPLQQQSLIVDTGSDVLTSPCKKCQFCGNHLNNFFDSSKSATANFITCDMGLKFPVCQKSCIGNYNNKEKKCNFEISYGEGSKLTGLYIQDYVQLQNNTKGQGIKMSFGCTTTETSFFHNQQANGILGVAPTRQYAFQQLFKQHNSKTNEQKIISLCLARNGGHMTVGGFDQSISEQKDLIKVKFDPNKKNLYSFSSLTQVVIQNQILRNNQTKPWRKDPFIDSGTTLTYFPSEEYFKLRKKLDQICYDSYKCMKTNRWDKVIYHLVYDQNEQKQQISKKNLHKLEQLSQNSQQIYFQKVKNLEILVNKIFPPIIFTINNKQIYWKANQYFAIYNLQNNNIILGVDGLSYYLFGQNWMVNKDIIFNNKDNQILIYTQIECNKYNQGYNADRQENDIRFTQFFKDKQKQQVQIITNSLKKSKQQKNWKK